MLVRLKRVEKEYREYHSSLLPYSSALLEYRGVFELCL